MLEDLTTRLSGLTGSTAIQYGVTFVVIFVVMALLALVLRKVLPRKGEPEAEHEAGQRGRRPRLGIVDVYEMDAQRRLILLRRDGVEHLLLVGGPNDVVVETDIRRLAALEEGMPEVRTPLPGPAPEDVRPAVRIEPSLPMSMEGQAAPGPVTVRQPPHPVELDFPAPGPKPETRPAAEPVTAREQRAFDPDVLSGMARQLEIALGTSPLPEAGPVRTERHEPKAEPVVERETPKVEASLPLPHASHDVKPGPSAPTPELAAPVSLDKADPAPGTPERPATAVIPLPEKPKDARRETPKPSTGMDPFSVDEIEAEFARLLGRPKENRN